MKEKDAVIKIVVTENGDVEIEGHDVSRFDLMCAAAALIHMWED